MTSNFDCCRGSSHLVSRRDIVWCVGGQARSANKCCICRLMEIILIALRQIALTSHVSVNVFTIQTQRTADEDGKHIGPFIVFIMLSSCTKRTS